MIHYQLKFTVQCPSTWNSLTTIGLSLFVQVQSQFIQRLTNIGQSATFNVGSGKATSVLAIANLLVDAFAGQVRPHVTGQYRLGDIRHCFADLTLIKEKLSFEPKVSLELGIHEFAAWVLLQPLPEDSLDHANEELKKRKMML